MAVFSSKTRPAQPPRDAPSERDAPRSPGKTPVRLPSAGDRQAQAVAVLVGKLDTLGLGDLAPGARHWLGTAKDRDAEIVAAIVSARSGYDRAVRRYHDGELTSAQLLEALSATSAATASYTGPGETIADRARRELTQAARAEAVRVLEDDSMTVFAALAGAARQAVADSAQATARLVDVKRFAKLVNEQERRDARRTSTMGRDGMTPDQAGEIRADAERIVMHWPKLDVLTLQPDRLVDVGTLRTAAARFTACKDAAEVLAVIVPGLYPFTLARPPHGHAAQYIRYMGDYQLGMTEALGWRPGLWLAGEVEVRPGMPPAVPPNQARLELRAAASLAAQASVTYPRREWEQVLERDLVRAPSR